MPAREEGEGGSNPQAAPSRLAALLRDHKARILRDWEQAARGQAVTRRLERPVLLDHLPALLDRIAEVVATAPEADAARLAGPEPGAHALGRIEVGFDLVEILAEYRLLRRCILRAIASHPSPPPLRELELLDGLLDDAMAQAVSARLAVRDRTLKELDRLFHAGLEQLELDELLPRLLRVLPETVPSVGLAVVLLREGARLTVRGAAGEDAEVARGLSVEMGEGVAGRIAAERKPLSLRFAATDPVVDRGVMRGMRALYGVPLLHGEEVAGVAYMASRTAFEFAEDDKLFFRVVADRVAALLAQRALLAREQAAREEARRATALLDSLMAAAPLGLGILDRELRYVRVNEVLAALNARPVKEHLGRSVWEVVPPSVWPQLPQTFRDILETGRPVSGLEVSAMPPSSPGEVRWWSANFYPVRRDDGWILGIGAVLVEITGRKRAEALLKEREEHLRLLAEGVEGLAFFTADPQGRVTSWNAGAARLFGCEATEILGGPLARLYPPEDADVPLRQLETAARLGRLEEAGARLWRRGASFQAGVTVTALRDAEGRGHAFALLVRARDTAPSP